MRDDKAAPTVPLVPRGLVNTDIWMMGFELH
jgi:hypothetical protein